MPTNILKTWGKCVLSRKKKTKMETDTKQKN